MGRQSPLFSKKPGSDTYSSGFHIDFLIHTVFPAYTSLFRAEDERNVPRIFFGNSFLTPEETVI